MINNTHDNNWQYRELWPGANIVHFSNTPRGWNSLTVRRNSSLNVFVTDLSPEAIGNSDLLNLQYFYLNADRFMSKNSNFSRKFVLVVRVTTIDDIYRVTHFLFLQNQVFEGTLQVYTEFNNDIQIVNIGNSCILGRISPLFSVSREPLSENLYFSELQNNEHSLALLNIDEAFDNSKYEYLKQDQSGDTNIQASVIKSLCYNNIVFLIKNVAGTRSESLHSEVKREIIDKIHNYLRQKLPALNLVTQLIWTDMLRSLVQEKELFIKIGDSPILEYYLSEIFEISLMDATAYADGLLQLIENSCLHTARGVAFFSLRTYYVSRYAPISKLKRAANSRIYLTDKYKHAKFKLSDEELFYLEICVSDDAWSQEFNSPLGLRATYNLNNSVQINCLKEMFQIVPANDDDIVYHYGLRLFRKIVTINGGCFSVRTPYYDVNDLKLKLEEYMSGIIEYEPNLIDNPDMKECRTTEYSILLPISYKWLSDVRTVDRCGQHENMYGDQFLESTPDNTELIYLRYDASILNKTEYTKEFSVKRIEEAPLIKTINADGETDSPLIYNQQKKIELSEKIKKDIEFALSNDGKIKRDIDETLLEDDGFPLAELIKNEIELTLPDSELTHKYKLVMFDLCAEHYIFIELFAKALFKYVCTLTLGNKSEQYTFFSLYFQNDVLLCEFLRLFSIFYNEYGMQPAMCKIQIALCSPDENNNSNVPDIKLVLAGSDILNAKYTAEIFSYYNSKSSMKIMPHIRYLLREENEKKEKKEKKEKDKYKLQYEPIFPFDLFLYSDLNTEGECWFIKRTEQMLNNEILSPGLGCKISDVHVRLASKIHLNCFYEAELLFQNISVVYRFAFMIANCIISDLSLDKISEEKKSYVLVGYEAYSTVLIQEIAKMLSVVSNDKIDFLTISRDSTGKPKLCLSPCLGSLDKSMLIESLRTSSFISVIPIATTFSTLYFMMKFIKNELKSQDSCNCEPNFIANYALIAVGNALDNDSNNPSNYYWTKGPHKNCLTLRPAKQGKYTTGGTVGPLVHYFMMPLASWHLPENCEENSKIKDNPKEEKALVCVDQTSTIPSQIFMTPSSRFRGFMKFLPTKSKEDENKIRFDLLRSCVTYSHIHRGNNHFLFFVDIPKYFGLVSNRKDDFLENHAKTVESWLRECKYQIESGAYNIVISPLHEEDSPFAKAVIDYAFDHSTRFLHFDIDAVYREDIRTKFSYVAEEYKSIKRFDPNRKINIYYVNTSIVSGQSIHRVSDLVKMLLSESGLPSADDRILKGIFVLVNRSSWDTVHNFVNNPNKEFFAYVHVAVPSYNTSNAICPTCKYVDKLSRLEKRSSSNVLSKEFNRVIEKHKLRTITEYDMWLKGQFSLRPNYLQWLVRWLYMSKSNNNYCKKEREKMGDAYSKLNNYYINHICLEPDNINFSKIKEDNRELFEDCLDVFKENVIAERNYMRLFCMDTAYRKVEVAQSEDVRSVEFQLTIGELIISTRKIIIECLNSCCVKDGNSIEWMISYIKVFSRDFLSRYYQIKQAIFTIMIEMLQGIFDEGKNVPEDLKTVFSAIYSVPEDIAPILQYQLFATLVKRLSDMQCGYLIRKDTIDNAWLFWERLHEKSKKYTKKHEDEAINQYGFLIPSKNTMAKAYIRQLKWACMSADEKSLCFSVEKTFLNYMNNYEKWDTEKKDFIRFAYLENIEIIYNGIDKLVYEWHSNFKDERFKQKIDRAIDYVKEERNGCQDVDGYLYQNSLSDFFKFFKMSRPNIYNDENECSIVGAMVLFYKCVNNLLANAKENQDDALPYRYEELCNYMREIVSCEECYLVYYRQDEVNLLTSTSIKKEHLLNNKLEDTTYKQADLEWIITETNNHEILHKCSGGNKIYLGETVTIADISGNTCNRFMSLKIGFPVAEKNQSGDVYIIFQMPQQMDPINEHELLFAARNILFMRSKLSKLFQLDLYRLLNLRQEFQYIKPLVSDNKSATFIHISDLHISKSNFDEVLNNLKKVSFEKADLLLITGDVIQGHCCAGDLENNYDSAEKVIKKIAEILWSEDGYVPNDWKKRIIIIPGNHDYASMNELEVMRIDKSRSTAVGKPAVKEGSTMAKFAYYINFIRKLLDLDVGPLIDNNLYEVRKYTKLDTCFICLNTSSEVNPIRNNKVHIDDKFVESHMLENIDKEKWGICLAHHTPIYSIDYVFDKYYTPSIDNELTKDFKEYIKNAEKELKSLSEEQKNSQLWMDYSYFKAHHSNSCDERCALLKHEIMTDEEMSENENKAYQKTFFRLLDHASINLILGGHRHIPVVDSDNHCYEAARFFCKDKINYSVLHIKGEEKKEYSYTSKEISIFEEDMVDSPPSAESFIPRIKLEKITLE